MKWVIIKGVRYPISVVSAFAAYYGDNPFLKIRIRNKYHIIYFDNMDYLNIQIRYLINNYPDFVQIGNWYISKKQVMSWAPKGQAVDGRWTQAAEELVSSCGLTEDECRKLQEESESFNDEMIKFIDNMFGRENMISEGSTISENDTICINIKYHKIGEVFNYKVGMSEMTLRVDKCDICSGCAFENYIYDCVKSGCLGYEREDGESVRYTIVNT